MYSRNRNLLLLALLLSPAFSMAQGPRDIEKVKTQTLKYDSEQYPSIAIIPFNRIEIIDYRFDTSKIGYAFYNYPENHTRLVVPGGLQEFLTTRLNDNWKNNLQPGSANTLVIVLKKLWLEYESVNELVHSNNVKDESLLRAKNRNSYCLADIDVFAKTDSSYQAVLRLAYDFTSNEGGRYNDIHLLMMPFDSIINKMQSVDIVTVLTNKRKFSFNDIRMNYNKRFDIPALTSDSFHRGIFLSFADFKKNKPSYPDFKYKIYELSTELTIRQDGRDMAITDYWGFYTGKDLYIKPGYLPFRVMRQGNTFDMLGAMRSKRKEGSIQVYGGISVPISTVNTILYPFQVDMETGKVY